MKVTGVVKKVFDRVHNGKTYYSLCVESDNEEVWHNTKQTKPKCREGDTVSFTSVKNNRGYWDANPDSIKVESKGAAPAAKGGGGWNDPARQNSIMAQASVDRAIRFVDMALRNEALSLGTAAAKAPKKFAALEAAVLEMSQKFFDMAANPDNYFGQDISEAAEEEAEEDFDPIND